MATFLQSYFTRVSRVKGKGLISNLKIHQTTFTLYPLVTGPVQSCGISTPRRAYSPAAILPQWTYVHIFISELPGTHSHLSKGKCISKRGKSIERGETWYFSENHAPSGVRNRAVDSDIYKAPRSNHWHRNRFSGSSTPSIVNTPHTTHNAYNESVSVLCIWCILLSAAVLLLLLHVHVLLPASGRQRWGRNDDWWLVAY